MNSQTVYFIIILERKVDMELKTFRAGAKFCNATACMHGPHTGSQHRHPLTPVTAESFAHQIISCCYPFSLHTVFMLAWPYCTGVQTSHQMGPPGCAETNNFTSIHFQLQICYLPNKSGYFVVRIPKKCILGVKSGPKSEHIVSWRVRESKILQRISGIIFGRQLPTDTAMFYGKRK